MHERELDKEHSLVTYSLPADAEKCVVNGNVSIAHSPNPHVGDNYYIYGPVTYLHQKGKGGDVTSTPCVLDVAADKVDLQNHEATNNSSKVCIVGEQKFKIRKLHILVAACLILVATAATLSTIFILRDRASAGGGDNDDEDNNSTLRIVERGEWFALPPSSIIPKLEVTPAPYVVIFEAPPSECFTREICSNYARYIQAIHLGNGYGDIGYHFMTGGDGSVYSGLGWDLHGAHTKTLNNRSIAVAFFGYFQKQLPVKKQIRAFWKLMKLGVEKNKIMENYTIFTFRDVTGVYSPGKAFYNLVKTWPHYKKYDSAKDKPPYIYE